MIARRPSVRLLILLREAALLGATFFKREVPNGR